MKKSNNIVRLQMNTPGLHAKIKKAREALLMVPKEKRAAVIKNAMEMRRAKQAQ